MKIRTMKCLLVAAAGLAISGCAGTATDARPDGETSIPSVTRMLEWRAGGDDLLYIRSLTGKWYEVRLDGRCARLEDATSLGFETSALGQLDRFGAILAEGERCPIAGVMRIDAPPPKSPS
jgi:hypothetical protein